MTRMNASSCVAEMPSNEGSESVSTDEQLQHQHQEQEQDEEQLESSADRQPQADEKQENQNQNGGKKQIEGASTHDDDDDDDDNDNNTDDTTDDNDKTVDEHGRELSAYEVMRLKRIKRNQQYLARLGLDSGNHDGNKPQPSLLSPFSQRMLEAKRRKRLRRQNQQSSTPTPTRSSSRRTTRINYCESHDAAASTSSTANNHHTPLHADHTNDAAASTNSTANGHTTSITKYKKKSEQLPMFIFREFKHQERQKRLRFKAAERLVKDATFEVKYAERKCKEMQKKIKLLLKRRRLCLDTHNRKHEQIKAQRERSLYMPIYHELKSRRQEIMQTVTNMKAHIRTKEAFQHQKEAQHKMNIIDAMDQFPLLVLDQRIILDALFLPHIQPNNTNKTTTKQTNTPNKRKSISNKSSTPKKKKKHTNTNHTAPSENTAANNKPTIITNQILNHHNHATITTSRTHNNNYNDTHKSIPIAFTSPPSYTKSSQNSTFDSAFDSYSQQSYRHQDYYHHNHHRQHSYSPQQQQQQQQQPCPSRNDRYHSPSIYLSSKMLPPMPSFLNSPNVKPQSQSDNDILSSPPPSSSNDQQESNITSPSSAKRPRKFRNRNIGGPITKQFSDTIQRKWLESDVPVLQPSPMFHFTPQVGDVVLYYPSAHRAFLKEHPDTAAAKRKSTLRKPLWERTVEFELEMKKQLLKPGKRKLKRYITRWWTDDWLRSTQNVDGCFPIICKVEHTVPEFPPNDAPNTTTPILPIQQDQTVRKTKKGKTDQLNQTAMTTTLSNQSQKQHTSKASTKRPPMCLSVTLRPLTPVLPPKLNPEQSREKNSSVFDDDDLPPPPTFSVLTFPSDDSQFLLPFVWAYGCGLSLSKHDPFKLQFKDGSVFSGTVLSTSYESSSTDNDYSKNPNSFDTFDSFLSCEGISNEWIQTKLSPLISDQYDDKVKSSSMLIPEIDFRAALQILIKNYRRRKLKSLEGHIELQKPRSVESPGTPKKEGYQANETTISDFLKFIQLTLPRWNGVTVVWNDESHCKVSSWDLLEDRLQDNKDSANDEKNKNDTKSNPSFTNNLVHPSNITDGGLIYTLDGELRSKIEKHLRDFMKSDDCSLFLKPVSEMDAPGYSMYVPVGMCFKRILRRLKIQSEKNLKKAQPKNMSCDVLFDDMALRKHFSYYRDTGAIISDMNDIFYNCLLYNNPESNIVSIARDVTNRSIALIEKLQTEHTHELKRKEKQRMLLENKNGLTVESFMQLESSLTQHESNASNSPLQSALFNHKICRDWVESLEPDSSWCSSENKSFDQKQHDEITCDNMYREWIPQCGDYVAYNFEMHVKFVGGHFSYLKPNQRIVPKHLGKIIDPKKKAKRSSLISSNDSHFDIRKSWRVGQIKRKRIVFPAVPNSTEDSTFEELAPLVALDISFHEKSLDSKGCTVFWRPCCLRTNPPKTPSIENEKASNVVTDSCEKDIFRSKESDSVTKGKTNCLSCGLPLDKSFICPAWNMSDSDIILGGESNARHKHFITSGIRQKFFVPKGIPKTVIASSIKCLNVIKQMSQDGLAPDAHDRCVGQLKKPVDISSKVYSDGLTDSDFGDLSSKEENKQPEYLKNLSKAHFISPWEFVHYTSEQAEKRSTRNSSVNSKSIDEDVLSEHEMMLPSPKLSLDLVHKRLQSGYYRQTVAAVADIQESYASSISYLMRKNIRKNGVGIESMNKIAKYCLTQSKTIKLNVKKLQKIKLQGEEYPDLPEIEIRDLIEGKDSVYDHKKLSKKEIGIFKKIQKVRKLYATAIVCLLHPEKAEIVFGVEQKEDDSNWISFCKKIPEWEADAKALMDMTSYVSSDPHAYRNPIGRFQPYPTITVKIKVDDERLDKNSQEITPENVLTTDDRSVEEVTNIDAVDKFDSDELKIKHIENSSVITKPSAHKSTNGIEISLGEIKPTNQTALVNETSGSTAESMLRKDAENITNDVFLHEFSQIDTKGPILIEPKDYEMNYKLCKIFFGRKGRYDPCVQCRINKFGFLNCRVRKAHSHPDCSWLQDLRYKGGIEPLLRKIRTCYEKDINHISPTEVSDKEGSINLIEGTSEKPYATKLDTFGDCSIKILQNTTTTDVDKNFTSQDQSPKEPNTLHTKSDKSDADGKIPNPSTDESKAEIESNIDTRPSQALHTGLYSLTSSPPGSAKPINLESNETINRDQDRPDTKTKQYSEPEIVQIREYEASVPSVSKENENKGVVESSNLEPTDLLKNVPNAGTKHGEAVLKSESIGESASNAVDENIQTEAGDADSCSYNIEDDKSTLMCIDRMIKDVRLQEENLKKTYENAKTALSMAIKICEEAEKEKESKPKLSEGFIKSTFVIDDVDGKYMYCVVCGLGGDILCCESNSCPIVVHAPCVGLKTIPEGEWYCSKCSKNTISENSKEPSLVSNKCEEGTEVNKLTFTSEAVTEMIGKLRSLRMKEKIENDTPKEKPSQNNSEKPSQNNSEKPSQNNSEKPSQNNSEKPSQNNSEKPSQNNSEKPTTENQVNPADDPVKLKQEKPIEIDFVIGTQLVKTFDDVHFAGQIVQKPTFDCPFYRVRYEDGDEEEMSLNEVTNHINFYQIIKNSNQYENLVEEQNRISSKVSTPSSNAKKKRGRPRKYPIDSPRTPTENNIVANISVEPIAIISDEAPVKRKRGRPPKSKRNKSILNNIADKAIMNDSAPSCHLTSESLNGLGDSVRSPKIINTGKIDNDFKESSSSREGKTAFLTPYLRRTALKRQKKSHLQKQCILIESNWVQNSSNNINKIKENAVDKREAEHIAENKTRRQSPRKTVEESNERNPRRQSSRLRKVCNSSTDYNVTLSSDSSTPQRRRRVRDIRVSYMELEGDDYTANEEDTDDVGHISESSFAETSESFENSSEGKQKRERRQSLNKIRKSSESQHSVNDYISPIPVKETYAQELSKEERGALQEYYTGKILKGRSKRYKRSSTDIFSSALY